MNKITKNIPLPQIEGVEIKNATVDLEEGVVVVEYVQEDIEMDISEIAVDFKSAADYLHEDSRLSYISTTKKLAHKLKALNQLLILAEAWNTFDGFKPDWEDHRQEKHYPLFEFINGKFEFSHVIFQRRIVNTHTSHFSFKTKERAEQFANKFIDLFRIILTN